VTLLNFEYSSQEKQYSNKGGTLKIYLTQLFP
jgi:hypothetical protein